MLRLGQTTLHAGFMAMTALNTALDVAQKLNMSGRNKMPEFTYTCPYCQSTYVCNNFKNCPRCGVEVMYSGENKIADIISELIVNNESHMAAVTVADKRYIYKYNGENWILDETWIRAKDDGLDPNYIIRPDGIIDKERQKLEF